MGPSLIVPALAVVAVIVVGPPSTAVPSSAAVAVAVQHGPLGPCWHCHRRKAFETETSSSLPSLLSPSQVMVGCCRPSLSLSSRRE